MNQCHRGDAGHYSIVAKRRKMTIGKTVLYHKRHEIGLFLLCVLCDNFANFAVKKRKCNPLHTDFSDSS